MQNYENKNNKEIRTKEIVDRLRLLQGTSNLSDSKVAKRVGITLSQYKNIIRSPSKGGNQKIDYIIIERLANLYECTTDYILGFSDKPYTDKLNRKITPAISFEIRNSMLDDLNEYLYDSENFSTLQNLHFLICKLPAPKRIDLLKGFNTFIDTLRKESFYGRIGSIPGDKLDTIMKINNDDPDYIDAVLTLANADSLLKKKELSKALHSYVKVVYIALTKNANMVGSLAEIALQKIERIQASSNDFPYDALSSLLYKKEFIINNNFFKCPSEVISDLKKFLNIKE